MAIRCSQDKGEKSAIEIVSGVSGGEYRNSCHQMWYLRLGLLWWCNSSSRVLLYRQAQLYKVVAVVERLFV